MRNKLLFLKLFKRPCSRARGVTVIELTVVLLVLLMLLFSIMEAGRAVMNYHTLYQAVSEGARFASVNGATSGSLPGPRLSVDVDPLIKQRVVSTATGMALTTTQVQVSWLPNNRPGSTVIVTANYLYKPFTFGWTEFTLTSSATVVILR